MGATIIILVLYAGFKIGIQRKDQLDQLIKNFLTLLRNKKKKLKDWEPFRYDLDSRLDTKYFLVCLSYQQVSPSCLFMVIFKHYSGYYLLLLKLCS